LVPLKEGENETVSLGAGENENETVPLTEGDTGGGKT
jgi:hypothetical protein